MGSVPRGVLLDIDGTLLLSNRAHAVAWSIMLNEFGFAIPADRIEMLIGMGGDKLLTTLIPGMSASSGEGKEISSRRQKLFLDQYAPYLQPAPGGRDLVQRLKDDGLKLVVATSAKGDELKALLRQAQIEDLIEEATTSDQVDESKPNPDVVQSALEKGGLAAEEAVLIGDTPYDVEAAKRAGAPVIAVRCGGHDVDLRGAIAVYDNPADLLAHLSETPLATGGPDGA
jgi:HAD superfamily hydrolase (TIGR01549 family)